MGSSRGGREKDFADARYKRRGCSAGPTTLMVLMMLKVMLVPWMISLMHCRLSGVITDLYR